ncbi:carboxypeptidase-like regulatory domain-containing protein [Tenacibaculum sp. nBUS_03]|uniref:carboxypeptidase-like regulatory domain-containing protein n=1 Tax=Tenacibaculum sp. nBUS_03 TaxID=3395320 RepID=UPI003EBE572F
MRQITKLVTVFTLLCFTSMMAQTVKGKVTDESGQGIPFIDVIEKGTTNGVSTNDNGEFTIQLKKVPSVLVFSSLGYATIEKSVKGASSLSIIMKEDSGVLDEVVLTGNRAKPRTILDSAVPIDNIGVGELQATGQTNIDQMLTYTVPSYNSTNQTISDATAHFDPADLRGLGP